MCVCVRVCVCVCVSIKVKPAYSAEFQQPAKVKTFLDKFQTWAQEFLETKLSPQLDVQ